MPVASVSRRWVEAAAAKIRSAEVIATLSLATDLGMGLPFEGLARVRDAALQQLGVDSTTRTQTTTPSALLSVAPPTQRSQPSVRRRRVLQHFGQVMFASPADHGGHCVRLASPSAGCVAGLQ